MLNEEQSTRLIRPLKGMAGFSQEKAMEAAEALRVADSQDHAIKAVDAARRLRNGKGEAWYPSPENIYDCLMGTRDEYQAVGLKGKEECPDCFGTGWKPGTAEIKCRGCGGSGSTAFGECGICDGEGKICSGGVSRCECTR